VPRNSERQREAAALYEYPDHLRGEIDALPRRPGVYTFHGNEGDGLPLYIGKSVDIRGRVLSHFRTPIEARLLRQARRITHERTAGDIGAQLREAQLIKMSNPLYNRKLRRTTRQFSIRLHRGKVDVVHSAEIDPAQAPVLYGLHSSKRAAMTALRRIADENRLCYTLIGIERGMQGRPCFRAMLRQCAGACHGGESLAEHEERLRLVLNDRQVVAWPFSGTVALEERGADMRQYYVIRDWQYLGSATTLTQARRVRGTSGDFDRDAYRILRDPVLSSAHRIVPLAA